MRGVANHLQTMNSGHSSAETSYRIVSVPAQSGLRCEWFAGIQGPSGTDGLFVPSDDHVEGCEDSQSISAQRHRRLFQIDRSRCNVQCGRRSIRTPVASTQEPERASKKCRHVSKKAALHMRQLRTRRHGRYRIKRGVSKYNIR